MTIYGWDCSDFDASRGPVDVAAAYRDGIRVFTHKLTEGTKVRHQNGPPKLAAARDLGMWCGGYQVPRTPGNGGHGTVAQQYDYLMAYVQANIPWWSTYPRWFWQVDLEHWSNSSGTYDAVSPAVGVEMVRLIRAATGRPVVLYAPRWAYGDGIGGDAPLWASDYGKNPAVPYRQAYPGDTSTRWARYSGRTPLVLQFGSRCQIGTQPGCDANAIRDERAWKALFTSTREATVALTDEERALLIRGNITPENALFYWLRRIAEGVNPVNGQPEGVGLPQLAEQLKALAAGATVDTAAIVDQVVERITPMLPTADAVAMALLRQLGAGATPQQSGTSPA